MNNIVQQNAPPPLSEKTIAQFESMGLDRPPTEVCTVAKAEAVKRLADRLTDHFNFSSAGAIAIANSVVDPSELRARIESTINLRVPGGTLIVLPTTVWSLRVAIDCTNPRAANKQQFQFGWRNDMSGIVPPIRQPEGIPNRCELKIHVNDRQHLEASLQQAENEVKTNNARVMESVPNQGVMVPTMLAVMHVEHKKTGDLRCALVTIDGSSRLTAAQTTFSTPDLAISPSDPFYKFSETRDFNSFVKRARQEFSILAPEHYDAQVRELQRNRCLTIPANVVVGYRPDNLLKPLDFATAIQGYRGVCHVAPPAQWGDAGQRDALSEGVIAQLLSEGLIGDGMASYIAGVLIPDEAAAMHLSIDLDVRAAHIQRYFVMPAEVNRKVTQAVSRGIKAMRAGSEISRVTGALRCEVAAELMIRPVRTWFTVGYVDTIRSSLERALLCPYFKEVAWGVSGLAPDALLNNAIAEVEDNGKPGPHAIELAAMGTFWLCVTHNIVRASSQRQAGTADWTEPSSIVKRLCESEWGLRVLHRAVVDGREFFPTKEDPSGNSVNAAQSVYALSEDGSAISGVNGRMRMTPVWIKSDVLKKVEAQNAAELASPEKLYNQLWAGFVLGVEELKTKLDAMERIKDPFGRRLTEMLGIVAADGKLQVSILQFLATRISVHTMHNEQAAQDMEESHAQAVGTVAGGAS